MTDMLNFIHQNYKETFNPISFMRVYITFKKPASNKRMNWTGYIRMTLYDEWRMVDSNRWVIARPLLWLTSIKMLYCGHTTKHRDIFKIMLNNTISFIEFIHWYIEILSTNISRGIMELSKSPAGDRKSKGQWRHGLWYSYIRKCIVLLWRRCPRDFRSTRILKMPCWMMAVFIRFYDKYEALLYITT